MSHTNSFLLPKTEPLLIVISGPSGVGKDAVIQQLARRERKFYFVITTTTRERRENERNGVDYFFVSRAEFERMIAAGELLEWAVVYGDYKGISKSQVQEAMKSGLDVILRVDVQGAATIRKLCPEVLTIFLTTRSEEELIERLKLRKSDPPEKLMRRIETAQRELAHLPKFDYVVVNEDQKLAETVDILEAIIIAEHHRVQHRKVKL